VVVDEFLLRATILPRDSGATREYGELRAKLEREGQVMSPLDATLIPEALL
jgi:predicted nucleic acid-binding protein